MMTPGTSEHWQAWCDRYGADYPTDEERRAAYRTACDTLAELRAVFADEVRPPS